MSSEKALCAGGDDDREFDDEHAQYIGVERRERAMPLGLREGSFSRTSHQGRSELMEERRLVASVSEAKRRRILALPSLTM